MFRRTFLCFFSASALFCVATPAADLNREMILTPPSGAASEDLEILAWQKRLAAPTARDADFERLGWAFVAKARRTLDAGYYKLAEKTADVMDAQFGASPAAALLRGHVFHNLHRFREAEAIARNLVRTRGTPEDWALLSDALMEQGCLPEAIDALQRFANVKPGPEADTRIAHIRWLKGDMRGAIAAMEQAVRETSPRDDESLAWMLTRLSNYWLQSGDIPRAQIAAERAQKHLAEYAPALLAQGRIALARREAARGADLIERAAKLNPLPEYRWWLAEAYDAAEKPENAAAAERELLAEGESEDPRTFALFLATQRRRTEVANRLAQAELATRADPLSHDAAAWASFAAGEWSRARDEIRLALSEGTKDPRLMLHAAVILGAEGETDEVRRMAADAQRGAAALLPSERAWLERVTAAVDAKANGGDGRTNGAARSDIVPYLKTTASGAVCAGADAQKLLSP